MAPQFSSTIFFWRWKNGTSVGQMQAETGGPSKLSSNSAASAAVHFLVETVVRRLRPTALPRTVPCSRRPWPGSARPNRGARSRRPRRLLPAGFGMTGNRRQRTHSRDAECAHVLRSRWPQSVRVLQLSWCVHVAGVRGARRSYFALNVLIVNNGRRQPA